MNKADLVEQISAGKNISKSAASEIVDLIIHRISSAQKKGEHVTLSGLGHFQTYQRQTGAFITISSRRVAKFTPGITLRKAVGRK